jgi:hypothetical protein
MSISLSDLRFDGKIISHTVSIVCIVYAHACVFWNSVLLFAIFMTTLAFCKVGNVNGYPKNATGFESMPLFTGFSIFF